MRFGRGLGLERSLAGGSLLVGEVNMGPDVLLDTWIDVMPVSGVWKINEDSVAHR